MNATVRSIIGRSLTLTMGLAIVAGCAVDRPAAPAAPDNHPDTATEIACRISVRFVGLDSRRGDGPVQVALWNSEERFMKDGRWVQGISIPIAQAENGVVFEDLPPGRYAISAFHDTQSAGTLRQGVFGIPLDPWAISNAGASIGPPAWRRASFEVHGADTVVELDFLHRPRPAR